MYKRQYRNLNAVVAYAMDGAGVSWVLSSEASMGSDFGFESAGDRFYQPHDATQLANGHVLLMDDGLDRPNCTAPFGKRCFSRAIEYELDTRAKLARVVWQFSYPLTEDAKVVEREARDVLLWDGGSVRQIATRGGADHYLVGFTNKFEHGDYHGNPGVVFEVDALGRIHASFDVRRTPSWDGCGLYRAVPTETIAGETNYAPRELWAGSSAVA